MNFTKASLNKVFSKPRNNFLPFIFLISLFTSCTKPEEYSLKGAQSTIPVHTVDTSTVWLQTEWNGHTSGNNLSQDVIGSYNDPLMGQTNAGVYTQLNLTNTLTPDFSNASFDSLVLVLKCQLGYDLSIGSITTPQRWLVYQINDEVTLSNNPTTVYYSDTVFAADTKLGDYKAGVNMSDSTLHIKLNSTLAYKFFSNPNAFSSQSSFAAFIQGLYIKGDDAQKNTNEGSLFEVLLTSASSSLTLYYHSGGLPYNIPMNMYSPAERVNTFSHKYYNTEAAQQLNKPSAHYGKALMQALGGLRVHVTLPYLSNYTKDSMQALYRAEFIFPKADSAADVNNTGHEPSILLLRPRDVNGKDYLTGFIDDQQGYYNGIYSRTNNYYEFTLTQHIQQLLYGFRNHLQFTDYGLNLEVPPSDPNAPTRIALATRYNKGPKPRLILTFSNIRDK